MRRGALEEGEEQTDRYTNPNPTQTARKEVRVGPCEGLLTKLSRERTSRKFGPMFAPECAAF